MVKKVEAFWNKHATFGTLLGRGAGEGRGGGSGSDHAIEIDAVWGFGVDSWVHWGMHHHRNGEIHQNYVRLFLQNDMDDHLTGSLSSTCVALNFHKGRS